MEEMEEREAKEEKERILNSNEVTLHIHHLTWRLATYFYFILFTFKSSLINTMQAIWQKAEEELNDEDEDDDDGPPPLPARDYAPPPLVSLLDPGEDVMARSIYLEEQRMPTLDDVPDVREEHVVYERSMSDEFNQNTTSLDLNSANNGGIVEENGFGLEAGQQGNLLHFADSMTQSAVFQVVEANLQLLVQLKCGTNFRAGKHWPARATSCLTRWRGQWSTG